MSPPVKCLFCDEKPKGSIQARIGDPHPAQDQRDTSRITVLPMCQNHMGIIHAVILAMSIEAGLELEPGSWVPVRPKKQEEASE